MSLTRRRFRKRIVFSLGLCALVLYFGPALLGRVMPSTVLSWVFPELAGALRAESLSLSWHRPLVGKAVALRDDNDENVIFIKELTTSHSLLKWISRPRQLGTFQANGLQANLVVDPKGMNVVRVLRPLFAEPTGKPAKSFEVKITDAEITLLNSLNSRQVAGKKMTANFRWHAPATSQKPFAEGFLRGELASDELVPSQSWSMKVTGTPRRNSSDLRALNWQAQLQSLPVAIIEALMPQKVHVGGQLDGTIAWRSDSVACQKVTWLSQHGNVSVDGSVPVSLIKNPRSWRGYRGPLSVEFDLDIAQLSQELEPWLPDQTRGILESLPVQGAMTWREVDSVPVFSGAIRTQRMTAQIDQVSQNWLMPIEVTWDIAIPSSEIQVRQLVATSPFGNVRAHGGFEQATLEADLDLSAIRQRLGDVLFSPQTSLSGLASLQTGWRVVDGRIQGSLNCEVRELRIGANDEQHFSEPELKGTATWALQQVTAKSLNVESARLSIDSLDDHLQIALTRSTPWSGWQTTWPVQMHSDGKLSAWMRRLRPWLRGIEPTIDGTFDINMMADISPQTLKITTMNGGGEKLKIPTQSGTWTEPQWRFDLQEAEWHRETGAISWNRLMVQSSTLAVSSNHSQWSGFADPTQVYGTASIRTDLSRLQQVYETLGGEKAAAQWSGEVIAKVMSRGIEDRNRSFDASVTARDLQVQPHAVRGRKGRQQAVRIPLIEAELVARITDGDHLQIDHVTLDLPNALTLRMSGSCGLTQPRRRYEFDGTITHDWQRLRAMAPAEWPIQMTGIGSQSIRLHGALPVESSDVRSWLRDGSWETRLAWDELQALGISLGSVSTKVSMQDGLLTTERIEASLNPGKLSLQPSLDCRSEITRLRFEPPARIENAELTPAMCRGWLRYAIPLLAHATSAEGQLSAEISEFELPIGRLDQGALQGKLMIERGRVGPSRTVQRMLSVLNLAIRLNGLGNYNLQNNRWIDFPNQEIEWSLRDGRVRHEGLRLQVGQLELTSSGSVGLDQSLDVVLGFKIPDNWLTGHPLLASLRGQTLFVPLEGSLEDMDLKTGVLVRVNEQLLRQTTSELFRQGLKRLFDN